MHSNHHEQIDHPVKHDNSCLVAQADKREILGDGQALAEIKRPGVQGGGQGM